MKENEAIKELHGIRMKRAIISQKRAEALDVAIQALEKQIPKKPYKHIFCTTTLFECPSCQRKQLINYQQYYCKECGQKLDWSEENE